MKFILREYLGLLKEDQELDALLSDLLFNMGILPITKPKKGRQYGVDIPAVGVDPEDNVRKVFLFVIKKGHLNRETWDTNSPTSVRPTLNEVLDLYIPICLSERNKSLPKKIIVCCNGERDPNVNLSWIQYTEHHTKKGEIDFDFWDIDKLSQLVNDFLLSENVLPIENRLLLRKSLAFLDLSDYELNHFEELIRNIFGKTPKNKKDVVKRIRTASLCLNIVYHWAGEINNLKPALIAAEKTLLFSWDWLRKNNVLDTYALKEFNKIRIDKRKIGVAFFLKLQDHCYVKDSLFIYGRTALETSLITWETIGLIAIIGLEEMHDAQILQITSGSPASINQHYENANAIAEGLFNLIINNQQSSYPKYDEHIIEIMLALSLFNMTLRTENAKQWMGKLLTSIHDAYQFTNFFPLFYTDYDKLQDIDLKASPGDDASSSCLLMLLIEWAAILNDASLYDRCKELATEKLKELNLQVWVPDSSTENLIYSSNATHDSGDALHSIKLPRTVDEYRQEISEQKKLFRDDMELSCIRHGFYTIAYVANRHLRTYPLPSLWRMFHFDRTETSL